MSHLVRTKRAALTPSQVKSLFAQLIALDRKAEGALWQLAKHIERMVGLGIQQQRIAASIGKSGGYVSELLATGRLFKFKPVKGVSFHRHVITTKAIKAAERGAEIETGKPYRLDPREAVTMMVRDRISDQRAATVTLVKKVKAKISPKLERAARAKASKDGEFVGQMFHADNADVVKRLPVGFARLWHLDPPYGQYTKTPDGSLDVSVSRGLVDCDNADEASAIRVTVEALDAIGPKLRGNDVVLLWQAGRGLRPEIADAMKRNGLWNNHMLVVWDKRRPQMGEPMSAWAYRVELLYVLVRDDGLLVNVNDSDRSQIMQFSPVKQSAANWHPNHFMQKPEDMLRFLIEKHSRPGDVVVDLFGCSGSFTIAAEDLGRLSLYVERNKKNYDFGSSRILARRKQRARKGKVA